MLSFPPAVRIWLATNPTDLRKSFDTLAEVVRQHLHNDPLSGHVFVFRNKRSDRVKLLEEGTFPFPAVGADQSSVTLRAAELAMLLDGVDWQNAKRSRRYRRPAS